MCDLDVMGTPSKLRVIRKPSDLASLIAKTEESKRLDTLCCTGRKNSKPNIGIHGHAGGTRPAQTRKTPKNLSAHESEERGREESVGLYVVSMRERGGWGREGCGLRNTISVVIHT